MKFDILTLFPSIINSYASESILKRGQKNGAIEILAHNFRDYAMDKHHKVDDAPYGGGPGMVLKPEPIVRCLEAIRALSCQMGRFVIPAKAGIQTHRKLDSHFHGNDKSKIVILDPAGKKFDQKMAARFAKLDRLVLICGRYEGFDERVYKFADKKISVGDYVLSGGELPALAIVEAVARLIPGVLGNEKSLMEETFCKSKIQISNVKSIRSGRTKFKIQNSKSQFVEYPQYTRPNDFMGLKVPKILLSGDHKKIEEWRRKKVQ